MVTLKDIALHCGVSIASVSKAINHMPGVGQKTAQRIREAAKSFGYLPNAAAQSLRTNRSFTIGVLLLDQNNRSLVNGFFAVMLEGFKIRMEEHGYDLMLLNRTVGKSTVTILEHCRYSNLDGVFVACIDFSDPEILELAASDVPLVSIDHAFKGHPSVYSDNEDGIYQAVMYAASLGHTKIAFIHGGESGVTDKRLNGYKKALKELKIPARQEYILQSFYQDIQRTYEATQKLLALQEPPTCILMPDDHAAHGGQLALQYMGVRVPDDISIIGFDGLEYLNYISPRLCTVAQDAIQIGQTAADLLINAIENKAGEKKHASVTIPVSLVKGETVATIT